MRIPTSRSKLHHFFTFLAFFVAVSSISLRANSPENESSNQFHAKWQKLDTRALPDATHRERTITEDGQVFVAVSRGEQLTVLNMRHHRELMKVQLDERIEEITLSKQGNIVAAATDDHLHTFHTQSGQNEMEELFISDVEDLRLSKNGSVLVASEGDEVTAFQSRTGRELMDDLLSDPLQEMVLSENGDVLALGTRDKVMLYNTRSGREIMDDLLMDSLEALHLSGNGDVFAVHNGGELRIFNARSGQEVAETDLDGRLKKLKISGNGDVVATVHGDRVTVFNGHSGRSIMESEIIRRIHKVRLTRNGGVLAVAHGRRITVFNARSGSRLMVRALQSHIEHLALSDRGNVLAVGHRTRVVTFNARSGARNMRQDIDRRIRTVALSPSGNLLAVGTGRNVRLFDPRNGGRLNTLTQDGKYISHVEFSDSGRILLMRDSGGDVELAKRMKGLSRDRVNVALLGSDLHRTKGQSGNEFPVDQTVNLDSTGRSSSSSVSQLVPGEKSMDLASFLKREEREPSTALSNVRVHALGTTGKAGELNTAEFLTALDWLHRENHDQIHVANVPVSVRVPSVSKGNLQTALKRTTNKGILIIAPAGERGKLLKSSARKRLPSASDGTLTVSGWVGASEGAKRILPESNYGDSIDLAAPANAPISVAQPSSFYSSVRVTRTIVEILQKEWKKGREPAPKQIRGRLMDRAKETDWKKNRHEEPSMASEK